MRKRRTIAWLVAAAVGLTLVPAMDAAAKSRSSAAEQTQNHRISRVVKQARATALKVASVIHTLSNLNKIVADNGQHIINLTTQANGIDGRLKGIEAAAPIIIAGLTKLGAAYPAVEYGRAGIFVSGATPTVAAGGTVTSADIPDDGNTITTGENAIVVAGAAGAMTIDLKAGIRSAESDGGPNEGGSSSTTAGQAGGYLYVVDLDTGLRVACGGGPPNPPGIIGTTPGDSIVTPSGTVTNLSLKNLPGGFERTDTTQPNSSSRSLLPGPCGFAAAAGHTYQVHYSVNFVDIPTSTTPGPTE
jgi:hypothetical protein